MKKPVIAIDLDITLFDTDTLWLLYLSEKESEHYSMNDFQEDCKRGNVSYNLTEYFPTITTEEGMKFWKDPAIYEECNIHHHAVETIKQLYQANCEIVFVTYCMGCPEHTRVKIKRLQKDFPFLLPDDFNFVATKKKGTVRCDVLIDDRNTFLNQQPENVKIIKYYSPYSQEETLDREHTLCKDWYQVEDEVVKFLEEFDYNE